MSNKNKVLMLLEENRNHNISGEFIASQIGVSRNAVNKIIKDLRKDGYIINAITNKGYTISNNTDIISAQGINAILKEDSYDKIMVYKSVDSTNVLAKKMALENDIEDGTVIIANEQTKGRGRMGREFYSPADSGIYMSFILKPNTNIQNGIFITTLASVLVCRAINKLFNISPEIKWVNDILINGKKVCGILTEATTDFETGNIDYVIVGIGINFSTDDFPEDISNTACSLKDKNEAKVSRNMLVAAIVKEFKNYKAELENNNFMNEYKQKSCVIGKKVSVISRSTTKLADVLDIDDNGALVIKLENGEIEKISSGEISIRGDFYND